MKLDISPSPLPLLEAPVVSRAAGSASPGSFDDHLQQAATVRPRSDAPPQDAASPRQRQESPKAAAETQHAADAPRSHQDQQPAAASSQTAAASAEETSAADEPAAAADTVAGDAAADCETPVKPGDKAPQGKHEEADAVADEGDGAAAAAVAAGIEAAARAASPAAGKEPPPETAKSAKPIAATAGNTKAASADLAAKVAADAQATAAVAEEPAIVVANQPEQEKSAAAKSGGQRQARPRAEVQAVEAKPTLAAAATPGTAEEDSTGGEHEKDRSPAAVTGDARRGTRGRGQAAPAGETRSTKTQASAARDSSPADAPASAAGASAAQAAPAAADGKIAEAMATAAGSGQADAALNTTATHGKGDAADATRPVAAATSTSPNDRPAARSTSDTDAPAMASRSSANFAGEAERARFVQRVSRAVQTAGERGGPLRLRLSPPELGALRLEVSMRGGVMAARLEAETPAARAMLLESLPALRERLSQHEIQIERFDVDLAGQSSGTPQDNPSHADRQQERGLAAARRAAAAKTSDTATAPAATRTIGPDQLNVVI